MKILVVDDSNTMRRIIINTLKKIGYSDNIEAGDGREALKKLEEGGFGLVITDWNMPGMDGLNLTKNIRTANAEIPILMVTTMAAKEDIIEALKAGVNNYVVKPMSPEVLEEKLNSIFNK